MRAVRLPTSDAFPAEFFDFAEDEVPRQLAVYITTMALECSRYPNCTRGEAQLVPLADGRAMVVVPMFYRGEVHIADVLPRDATGYVVISEDGWRTNLPELA